MNELDFSHYARKIVMEYANEHLDKADEKQIGMDPDRAS